MTEIPHTSGTPSDDSPVVRIAQGDLRGRHRRGVQLFAGIPYAAPPTGPRRFRAPEPAQPWDGIRDARRFGPAAPQLPGEGLTNQIPVPWDEDCLTLNVVTPSCEPSELDGALRPVYVWIHGGAYKHGQGSTPWYDGTSFAARGDVVVVTINYRLGALGFCNLGSHLGDDFATCGINGTLDQIAAVKWVRENVAAFGGDPDRITIGGESAGAFSVSNLLAMPSTRGLFHQAIAQSGALHHTFDPVEGKAIAGEFLAALGQPTADELMAVHVDAILEAQEQVSVARGQGTGRSQEPFYPVWGHDLLPDDPRDLVAGGHGSDVPLLTGTNEDELSLWGVSAVDSAGLADVVGRTTGDPEAMLEVYRQRLGDERTGEVAPGWLACAIGSDKVFGIPAIRHAEYRHAHDAVTWMYRFSWDSRAFDGLFGAAHALEIPFSFNTIDRPGVDVFLGPGDRPTTLAETMHDAWISFIRNGDPSTSTLGEWPPYTPDDRAVMELDDECVLLHDPRPNERQAWEGIVR
ncbi:MAG TPA: carboxylesterase [Acidimicrobiaceae bacterium]|nr:carboxylesterase [Acidimicrobiaceae bacterium]HCV33864.1 carboxylesterase [Acidimicrobiaceae bacterium]